MKDSDRQCLLATLAVLVYRKPGESELQWVKSIRARVVRQARSLGVEIQPESIQCHIQAGCEALSMTLADGSEGFIAVRGTWSLWCFLQDVCCLPVRFLHGRAHRGFLSGLIDDGAIQDAMRDATPETRWHIVGHSKGGSQAALIAANCVMSQYRKTGRALDTLTMLCPPRFADQNLKWFLETGMGRENIQQVRLSRDLIAYVPPKCLGYTDVGVINLFNRKGDYYRNPGKWYRRLDTAIGLITGPLLAPLMHRAVTARERIYALYGRDDILRDEMYAVDC